MSDQFEALAQRCEQAAGPDRELDFAINDIAGRCPTMPQFTASVDAALTLVPEGYARQVAYWPGQGVAHAWLWTLGEYHECVGKTEALAMAGVALRARAEGAAA